jgi:hypothetical protein
MLKEQDAAQQRINEITKKGEIDLGNTLKQLRETAKLELEAKQKSRELAYARINGVSPEALKTPILQTQETPTEEAIDDQGNVLMSGTGTSDVQPVATPTPAAPAPVPAVTTGIPADAKKYILANLDAGMDEDKAVEKGMEQYHKEKDAAVKTKEEQTAAQKKQIADQWLKIRGSKDEPISLLEVRAVAAPAKLVQLEDTLIAAEKAGVTTKLGAFVNTYLPDLSPEAKKLLDAGVDDVAARAAAFRPLSNEEKELLLRAAPSLNNPIEFNRYKIKLMQYLYTRDAKFLDFRAAAEEELGLSPTKTMAAWLKYETAMNQKLKDFNSIDEAREAAATDDSWKDFLYAPKDASTATPTKTPVSRPAAPPAPAASPELAKETEALNKLLGL